MKGIHPRDPEVQKELLAAADKLAKQRGTKAFRTSNDILSERLGLFKKK